MTKRSAFEKNAAKLKPRTLIFLAHLLLMLAASVSLLLSASAFQKRLNEIRLARTDNGAWIVSQLEVDHLSLMLEWDEIVFKLNAEPPQTIEEADILPAKQKFDVFYSRVDVVVAAMRRLDASPAMQSNVLDLLELRERLARQLDAIVGVDPEALVAFRESVSDVRSAVREISVSGLQELVKEQANVGDAEARIFKRFFVQSVILFLLMGLGSYLVVRLWRELYARGRETSRIAAILSTAFDATLNAILVMDDSGQVIYGNEKASDICNRAGDDLRTEKISDLLAIKVESRDGQLSKPQSLDRSSLANLVGEPLVVGYCVRQDGSRIPVEFSVIEDEDLSGKKITIAFIRNISDRVRAQENWRKALTKANEAAQAKSMFLATMSHEMRTPLHGMMASLALIDETVMHEENKILLQTARDCSARALSQVDDVLELTKLGESREEFRPFDPKQIVSEIANELQTLAARKESAIKLCFKGAFEDLELAGLPKAFSRTLYNLVGNAVKFTADGLIVIRLTLKGTNASGLSLDVEVEDTGIGIAPENQARIFEIFETVKDSDITVSTGSGLGLAIARLAVEQQGGKLQLSSIPGIGSRFFFTIPLKLDEATNRKNAPAADPDQQILEVSQAGDGKGVLVVDDNDVNLTLMAEMVRRIGHHPDTAKNGQDAVHKAGNKRYDVILMDFSMPVMDGPTATQVIRDGEGLSYDAIVIGVTALMDETAGVGGGLLMDAVLTKPVDIAQLQRTISRLISKPPENIALPESPLPKDEANEEENYDWPEDIGGARKSFESLADLVGLDTARQLIRATFEDAQNALDAIEDDRMLLKEKTLVIHKAVGSTSLIGLSELSENLSEAERRAAGGQDPRADKFDIMIAKNIAEAIENYTGVVDIF